MLQTQKAACSWFSLWEMPRRGKSTETESRLVVVRGWGKGGKWVLKGMGFIFYIFFFKAALHGMHFKEDS